MDLIVTESYQTDRLEKLMRDAANLIADGMQANVTAKLMCRAGDKEVHKAKPRSRIMSQSEMELVARKAKMAAAGFSPSRPDMN